MEVKNVLGGLLAGVTIGIAIGMLLAPASGKKKRKEISQGSGKFARKLKKGVKGYTASLKDKYNAGVDDVTQKSKEVINGLSDGAGV